MSPTPGSVVTLTPHGGKDSRAISITHYECSVQGAEWGWITYPAYWALPWLPVFLLGPKGK